MKPNATKTKGTWIFVAPVEGLKLTEAIKKEYRIDEVLFVSRVKLPQIRKRLKFFLPVSGYIQKRPIIRQFFETAPTFAVMYRKGNPETLKTQCQRVIENELAILSLSQLGYAKRRHNSYPRLKGQASIDTLSDMVLNTGNESWSMSKWISGKPTSLILDEEWRKFQKDVFFKQLTNMVFRDKNIKKGWRQDLQRAAILSGQSQTSSDVAQAFLWNMIALEILLTRQGDKYRDALPQRIEAFLGWTGYWQVDGYETQIQNVYTKRCKLVHDGAWDKITIKDLLFTDDLLLNLFTNIACHQKLFKSKDDVIKFGDKVAAEHLLGLKPKIQPKTLRFISRQYSEKDFEQI